MTSSEKTVSAILSPRQCRAARALLAWSQADLAKRASVGISTVADFERGQRSPVANNLEAMRAALEKAGITVLAGGVVAGPPPASMTLHSKVSAEGLRPVRWVDESDLAQWADRRDGQDTLPELVRRLIIAEQGYLPDLRFPSGDSVSMHGWDGLTQTDKPSEHVPARWSGWEIGADRDSPTKKANRAYADRTKNPAPLDPINAALVIVTPRRWAKKDEWLIERRSEKKWADVRALDAVDLVQWVERYPAIGLWLLGLIKRQKLEGAQHLREAWREWSLATRRPLTEGLVLAGRDEEAVRVWRWLREEPAVLAVEAGAPAEAIGFLYAAIGQLPADYSEFYHGKTVVVASPEIARSLADMPTHLIIVLEQPEPGVASRLIEKGHHVFLPFGAAGPRGDAMPLSRPSRYDLQECLVGSGYKPDEAKRYAHDSARSLTILRRLVPASPGYKTPEWAKPDAGRLVLPALFAGAWDERQEADRNCLAHLAGTSYETLMAALSALLPQSDSPLRKAGTVWKIASPRDAWFLLAPLISSQDVDRFAVVAKNVLSQPDPRFALQGDQRMYAAMEGQMPRHSGYLRTGLAETTILLGAFGDQAAAVPDVRHQAGAIVRHLIRDASAETWWSLSDQLRELAEAAPDVFLECVEDSLVKNDPPIIALFKEDEGGLFGRSYHAELLWALETLAWSGERLGKVTELLAALMSLDPGGSLANRPARSLRQIYLLWHPQTTVRLDDRLKVLGRLRKRAPNEAWRLFLDLYPKSHDTSHNNPLPRWRDFSADEPEIVTRRTIYRGAEQLGAWLLEDAGTDPERWSELIARFADLSRDVRSQLVAKARGLGKAVLDDTGRARIQGAMRSLINHHRKYGTAGWALGDEDLAALQGAYEAIPPRDTVHGIAWLFDQEEANLLEPAGHDHQTNCATSRKARIEALKELMSESGMDDVKRLVASVRMAGLVGEAFAVAAEPALIDETLAVAIKADDQANGNFAHGMIVTCARSQGDDWSDRLVDRALEEKWGDDALARILLSLPSTERAMRRTAEIGGKVAEIFWSQISIYRVPDGPEVTPWVIEELLKHGRAHGAVKLAGHATRHVSPDLLVRVLEMAARSERKEADASAMFQYNVEQIFERLDQSKDIDPDRVARLEWTYLKVLEDSNRPPVTLHKQLASRPEFFVEVLSTIYRASSEEPDKQEENRESKAALASHAWTLLHSWNLLPGFSEGKADGAALEEWVTNARRLCHEAGRAEIGDEQIGQMLAWAPSDADGTWPCEAVRDAIEMVRSRHLETGVYIGVKNRRGTTSRGVTDGGEQERDLAKQYRDHADAIRFEWPRTAAVVGRIAESYEVEAREHDDDAERYQW